MINVNLHVLGLRDAEDGSELGVVGLEVFAAHDEVTLFVCHV